MPSKSNVDSLEKTLAAAERDLEERSGTGSVSGSGLSEERDHVQKAREAEDEIGHRSNASQERRSNEANDRRSNVSGSDNKSWVNQAAPPPPVGDGASMSSEGTANSKKDKGSMVSSRHSKANSGVASGVNSGSGGSGSGGSGNVRRLLEMQQLSQPGPSDPGVSCSSSHPSSGGHAGAQPSNDSIGASSSLLDSLSSGQTNMLERIIQDMMSQQNGELNIMHRKVEESEEALRDKREKIAKLKAQGKTVEVMQENIALVQQTKLDAQDQRDHLKDVIAGMEAKHESQQERLVSELEALKADKRWSDWDMLEKKEEQMKTLLEALDLEKTRAAAGRQETRIDASDVKRAGTDRRANDIAGKTEVEDWRVFLEQKRRELERKEREARTLPGDTQDNARDRLLREEIQESIDKSVQSGRELKSELAEVRLAMFNMNRKDEQELAVMQMQLDNLALTGSRPASLQGPLRKPAGGKRRGKPDVASLGKIEEEEDSDDGFELSSTANTAVSGQVSSDGIGVGDLHDFDPDGEVTLMVKNPQQVEAICQRIAELSRELNQADSQVKALQDDKAEKDALVASKLKRVNKNLRESQVASHKLEDQVCEEKEEQLEQQVQEEAELTEIRRLLKISEQSRDGIAEEHRIHIEVQECHNVQEIEDLEEQLQDARDMQRACQTKLHDAKLELANCELRHAQVISDLHTKIQAYEDQGGGPHVHREVDSDLLERLHSTEQEVNMLRNDLEWKEVHWKSQLEAVQHPHEIDLAKLRALEEELKACQGENQRLQDCLHQVDGELDDASNKQQPIQRITKPPEPAGLLAQFRCPSRSQIQRPPAISVSCQDVCWKILMSIEPAVVALHCDAKDLGILECSKGAYVIWGATSLHGSSLLDLSEKTMRTWLQKRLEPSSSRGGASSSGIERFNLWQLPCVRFVDQTGVPFDAAIVCASLPAEMRHDRCSAILVIVDIMEASIGEPSRQRLGGSCGPSGSEGTESSGHPDGQRHRIPKRLGTPSGISMNSDEVSPNDSISCVIFEQSRHQ